MLYIYRELGVHCIYKELVTTFAKKRYASHDNRLLVVVCTCGHAEPNKAEANLGLGLEMLGLGS